MVQKLYVPIGDMRFQVDFFDPGDPEVDRGGDGSLPAPGIWKKGVWARLEVLQGRELLKAQQIVADVTHRVTIRYMSGVQTRMILRLTDGRNLEIQDIQDPDERKVQLDLLCAERS